MTLKQKIVSFLEGKEKVSLKDMYVGLQEEKDYHIRAVLNNEVKHNRTFIRLDKGIYKLKIE